MAEQPTDAGDASADRLEVRYELGERDAAAGYRQGALGHPKIRRMLFIVAVIVLPLAGFYAITGTEGLATVVTTTILLIPTVLVFIPWMMRQQARRNAAFRGPHTLWISPQNWTVIQQVRGAKSHIFFHWKAGATTIIPRAAFPTPEAAEEFLRAAQEWHRAAVEAEKSSS